MPLHVNCIRCSLRQKNIYMRDAHTLHTDNYINFMLISANQFFVSLCVSRYFGK